MKTCRNEQGQIALPLFTGLLAMIAFFFVYVVGANNTLERMRLEMIADATAVSVARAQAEELNLIVAAQDVMNLLVQKFRNTAAVDISRAGQFNAANKLLRSKVQFFSAMPLSVGHKVAKANGVKSFAYFPIPMPSYLVPKELYVYYVSSNPPFIVGPHYFEKGYFARGWAENYLKAQPPHKTTWMVQRRKISAIASARVWLDVDPQRSWAHNGGFPRVNEPSLFRSIGIQGWHPQFNGRLLPQSAIRPEKLLEKMPWDLP